MRTNSPREGAKAAAGAAADAAGPRLASLDLAGLKALPAPARRPLLAALAWSALVLLALPLSGLPRFGLFWLVFAASSLGLVAGELLFLRAIYLRGNPKPYLAWKKFSGYAIPFHYALAALPRVQWSQSGLIGEGGVVYLFVLVLLPTLAGCLAFWLMGRPAALAAFGLIDEEELRDPKLRKARAKEHRPKRGLLFGILDWVDALAWAAIAVLVLNIFLFQLYVVPSESMVPAFLVGDRPVTVKVVAGPRIPLTEWRLPFLRLPKRGDVVTIANPRYEDNHRVDLKKYYSQFLFMLTFTRVNLNATLPDGTPRADPLVKRLVGLPGERLMMVDDVMYVKTKADAEFRVMEEDKAWARPDLWKESEELKAKVATVPLGRQEREFLDALDARKNAVDAPTFARAMAERLERIEAALSRLPATRLRVFAELELPRGDPLLGQRRKDYLESAAAGGDPMTAAGIEADDLALSSALAESAPLRGKLRAYVEGALASARTAPPDLYRSSSRALSFLIKDNLLARIERDLALLAAGAGIADYGADPERARLLAEARALSGYLSLYDTRNFPAFPGDSSYLAADEYFCVGDNRYNSFDFRYSTEPRRRALDPGDPASIAYTSIVAPFPVKLQFIEAYALFRVWPPSRFGPIK